MKTKRHTDIDENTIFNDINKSKIIRKNSLTRAANSSKLIKDEGAIFWKSKVRVMKY